MLLSMLDGRGENESRQAYRDFVRAGLGAEKPGFLPSPRKGRHPVVHNIPQGLSPRSLNLDELTAEIWCLRSEGRTLREIAEWLGVSAMTIERHLKRRSPPGNL
jgi:DNA-binding NarL/FixJ family response regulator